MYRILSQLTLVLQNTPLGKLKQVTEWQKAFAPVEPVAADPTVTTPERWLGAGWWHGKKKNHGRFFSQELFSPLFKPGPRVSLELFVHRGSCF